MFILSTSLNRPIIGLLICIRNRSLFDLCTNVFNNIVLVLCCSCHVFIVSLITFVMADLWNRAGHYIFVFWFLLPFLFRLFSSPIIIRRSLNVISKSTSENCIKIRWFLTKLETKISWLLFMAHDVVFRPHRSTMYVDAAYCDRPSSVVCRSVGLSVTLVSLAKTAAPIELPFGLRTWVGPRNHVLDGGPDPPWKGANFWGRMGVPL